MIACVDVDYRDPLALAACVVFNSWIDETVLCEKTRLVEGVKSYQSGEFFRRELPCIMAVLKELEKKPNVIIVDGYVWLNGSGKHGLGAHLFYALDRKIPVIGVAKKPYGSGNGTTSVFRGESKKPLYITSAGIDPLKAAMCIRTLTGHHRIPNILKRVDRLCRNS